MELPLVEEIREARRLSEESRDATIHLQRVNAALTSISVVEHQLAKGLTITDLPGEEILDVLVERWSQLADLRSADLSPWEPFAERLRARKRQLQQAWNELKPLEEQSEVRAHHLGHLQDEQRHLLEDPRWAEATAELHALGVERERYARALGPVRQRLSMVGPAADVVRAFQQRIEAELRQLEMLTDPTGIIAWRALAVTEGMLSGIGEAIRGLGLEIPTPTPPQVPASYEEAEESMVRSEIRRALEGIGDLLEALDAQRSQLDAENKALSEQLDALTQQIVDRMG